MPREKKSIKNGKQQLKRNGNFRTIEPKYFISERRAFVELTEGRRNDGLWLHFFFFGRWDGPMILGLLTETNRRTILRGILSVS